MNFRLHYITMYFADNKFSNKKVVAIQAFTFSRFKRKHLNRHPNCHVTWIQITDKTQNDYQTWYLRFYRVLQISVMFRLVDITKRFIQMTLSWLPGELCTIFSKEIISLFHIKCKLLQSIRKTADVSH